MVLVVLELGAQQAKQLVESSRRQVGKRPRSWSMLIKLGCRVCGGKLGTTG